MLLITFFTYLYQIGMAFTAYRNRNLRSNVFDPSTWERFAPAWVGLDRFRRILTSRLTSENYYSGRLLLANVTWTVTNVFVLEVLSRFTLALALRSA